MKDTIYREDAIRAINLRARIPHDIASAHYASMAINAICSVPSADRPQGKWIKDNLGIVICSECKRPRRDNRVNHINFCNSCGVKMKGADDED